MLNDKQKPSLIFLNHVQGVYAHKKGNVAKCQTSVLLLELQLCESSLNEQARCCLSGVMVVFGVQQTMAYMGHSSNVLPTFVAKHPLCYS